MFRSKKKKALPEINTTALPDIIFMLLFFFMVVTVLKKDEKTSSVKIPQVGYAELLKGDNLILLSVLEKENGLHYYIDSHHYRNLDKVEQALRKIISIDNTTQSVKIQADKSLPMSKINEIKRILQQTQHYKVEYLAATVHQ